MTDIEKINQAFIQLSFCLKNMCYFELEPRKINKEDFDTEVQFLDERVILPQNEFITYDDLILAAQNQVNICIGFTAIVVWDTVESFNKSKLDTEEKNIIDLFYMIRCAFVHQAINPVWKVNNKQYKRVFEIKIGDSSITVDLTDKDSRPFKPEDIGGYQNYYKLKDSIIELLKKYSSA